MTVRLPFCILTLLVMTLISIQHPVSIVNSDVSQTKHPDLQASKYKEKEDTTDPRFKKQSRNEYSESLYKNQHVNLKQKNKVENDRNKRLETEEDDGVMERNQFYKPINEETKDVHPVVSSKQHKEGKPDHKISYDVLGPAKLAVAKVARSQRQEAGGWGNITGLQPNRAGGLRNTSQQPEEFNGKSVDGEYMWASNSTQRKGRENYEIQELAGMNFSPEAQETMRKINPLTIGDQVSQMIHDRHCKPKNKQKSIEEGRTNTLPTFRCGLAARQHEDQAGAGIRVPQANDVPKLLFAQQHEDQAGAGVRVPQANDVPKLLSAQQHEDQTGAGVRVPQANDVPKLLSAQQHEDQTGAGVRVPQANDVPKLLSAQQHEDQAGAGVRVPQANDVPKLPATQQHEDQAGAGVRFPQANDVPKLLAASSKDQLPKILQKPSSSHDYGFSVYLLARDPANSGGSGARNENKKINGADNNIEECKYAIKTDYNKVNSINVKSSNNELRVEKNPNPNVEFPVYDQDLTFTPDPLHGLLEHHDRINPVPKEDNTKPLGGSPAFHRHMVHARSVKKKNSKCSDTSNSSLSDNGNKDGDMNGSEEDDNANGNSAEGKSAGGDSVGDDSQTPDTEPSGDSNNDTNKTSCMSWSNADNRTGADDGAGDDDKSSDLETFGDLEIETNKTSCLSWNDNAAGNDTSGCGMTEETTGATAESSFQCETATPEVETCGDLEMNTNKTCCKSWREKESNKRKLTLP